MSKVDHYIHNYMYYYQHVIYMSKVDHYIHKIIFCTKNTSRLTSKGCDFYLIEVKPKNNKITNTDNALLLCSEVTKTLKNKCKYTEYKGPPC